MMLRKSELRREAQACVRRATALYLRANKIAASQPNRARRLLGYALDEIRKGERLHASTLAVFFLAAPLSIALFFASGNPCS